MERRVLGLGLGLGLRLMWCTWREESKLKTVVRGGGGARGECGEWRWSIHARSGRGTPPTKMVLRGSSGCAASITKSESVCRHGRICTCSISATKH